jgi:hypothetical protein
MNHSMRDPLYLKFLRTRPCSFCGNTVTEPHHSLRRLPGLGAGGIGLKGPDYAAIPACRPCHVRLHSGGGRRVQRAELLELIVLNLAAYCASKLQSAGQKRAR